MNFVFFTDRDLGLRFPAILAEAGLKVHRHQDHFEPDCPDEVWLKEIGKRRWVAVTHDKRIRYKPNELSALMRHRVRLIVVVGKGKYPKLAESFVRTAPRIESFLARHTAPFIAKVYRASPVDLLRNPDALGRVERSYPT